jgi:UDP-2-acetamido-3-amino-2,3-dideoxy-glucuronate N-acetyltransferase
MLDYLHYIDSTAIVEVGAVVGLNSKIWHHTHICHDAKIGDNCIIGDNVYVGPHVKIGNGCKIQNNCFLPSGVILEDDVFLGPHVVFTNIVVPRAFIERKDEFKTTIVFKGASIGANSTILSGLIIGNYAMIGAGSVVTRDIFPYAVAFGNPAREMGTVNVTGDEFIYYEEDEGK